MTTEARERLAFKREFFQFSSCQGWGLGGTLMGNFSSQMPRRKPNIVSCEPPERAAAVLLGQVGDPREDLVRRRIGRGRPMGPQQIQQGDSVIARDALGRENKRRAITGVIAGQDFPVVWLCNDQEWDEAARDGREPEGVPFPAEDVWLGGSK